MNLLMQSLSVIGVCLLLIAFLIIQRHLLDAFNTSWKNILNSCYKSFSKKFNFAFSYISLLSKSHQYFNALPDEKLIDELNEAISFGFYKKAEPHLIKLVSMIEDDRLSSLYEQLAVCYFHQKHFKKALIILEQALQRYPRQASLYAWYGRILHSYGKNQEAQKMLNHARSLEKNSLVNLIYNEVCDIST